MLAADEGEPPYALAELRRELWATAAALLGAACIGAGVGDDELNLMLRRRLVPSGTALMGRGAWCAGRRPIVP